MLSESDWGTSQLDAARAESLRAFRFEKILAGFARSKILDAKVEPLHNRERRTLALNHFAQVVIRLEVEGELFDALYNGPDGMRSRFWRSPQEGEAATRLLIDALRPRLVDATYRLTGGARRMSRAEVSPPQRRGFGTRLLQDGLTREFASQTRLGYASEGVRCDIEVPLGTHVVQGR